MPQNHSNTSQSGFTRAFYKFNVLLIVLICHSHGSAFDWPQILGPNRNGQAVGEPAIKIWSADGPALLWKQELGEGYAGPAVTGDRVTVFHRIGDVERIESFHARTGESQWRTDFQASYAGGVDPDRGPRCVPLINGSSVYVFGAAGNLHCVELASGRKRWSRDLYREYGGREGYFGAGSTPIVVDQHLIVNVGGDSAGVVALDLATGETVWKTTEEGASYSSPASAKIDGTQHVFFVTRLNTISVDPANGDVRFRFPFGRQGPTVNAATPLIIQDRLFVSSSYGVGARLSQVTANQAREIWANDDVMSSQYSTCVHHNGFLYGTHGREDYNNGEYRCIDFESGKIQWKKSRFPVSHTILVGDHLLLLGVDGSLRLLKANPRRYEELAVAKVSSNLTRALPALSNSRLYFRDNAGRTGQLICVELPRLENTDPDGE